MAWIDLRSCEICRHEDYETLSAKLHSELCRELSMRVGIEVIAHMPLLKSKLIEAK